MICHHRETDWNAVGKEGGGRKEEGPREGLRERARSTISISYKRKRKDYTAQKFCGKTFPTSAVRRVRLTTERVRIRRVSTETEAEGGEERLVKFFLGKIDVKSIDFHQTCRKLLYA